MTMFRAFGRFMPDGDLQFVEYDYPTEAAFRQDLSGNGFAAKWVLPVDLIEKYDWDTWTSTFGQKSFYGPNYKKLTSKFKQCIKWYEDNKAILSQLYGLDNFYNAAQKWVNYDVYFSHSNHYPTVMYYLQSLKDEQDKRDAQYESFGEYVDHIKESIKQ